MAEIVQLVGPDGREYEFDPSQGDLAAAQAKGYRVLGAGESRGVGEVVKAGAHEVLDATTAALTGALEGATFGATKSFSERVRGDPRAPLSIYRPQEHDIAEGAGKVAGFFLSPINKLAAPLAGVAGTSTAGARLGGALLEGAGIGALAGAGEAVGDASLPGSPELNAETLLSHVGLGALLGAGGAGVGTALVEGASAVLPKLGGLLKGAKFSLDEFANDAALGATRAKQGAIGRLTEEELGAAARVLREREHLGLTPSRMSKSIADDAAALEARQAELIEQMEARRLAEEGLPSRGGLEVTAESRFAEEAQGLPARSEAPEEILTETPRGVTVGSRGRPVEEPLPGGSGYEVVEGSRFDVPEEKLGLPTSDAFTVSDASKFATRPVSKEMAALQSELTATEANLSALRTAAELTKSGSTREGGIQLKDLMVGGLGGSFHPAGIASAIGSKFVREFGPGIVAKAADAIASSPSLMAVANGLAAKMTQAGAGLGVFAPAMASALAKGPQVVLATHMLLSQTQPEYAQTVAPLLPGRADGPGLERAASVAQVAANLAEADRELDAQIERVFKGAKSTPASSAGQDFGAKRMRQSTESGHATRTEEIRLLAADPQALVDRIAERTGNLSNVTPALAASMAQTAQRAVDYLVKSSEHPSKAGPLAAEWKPSSSEQQSFARKYAAIIDPSIVLRHAAAGTMTPDEWEAVRTVYPALAQSISNKALEKLTSGPKVPYRSRLMVSMLAGVSADGSSSGASIAQNQAAIQSQPKKQSAKPPPESKGTTPANRWATPSQRREMRDE